jgi:hypothetical protein
MLFTEKLDTPEQTYTKEQEYNNEHEISLYRGSYHLTNDILTILPDVIYYKIPSPYYFICYSTIGIKKI